MEVIKRGGGIEEFDEKKIVIALEKCGASRYARDIAKTASEFFKDRERIHSYEIREFVIRELAEKSKGVLENFTSFQKTIDKLVSEERSIEEKLIEITGDFASVNPSAGGYEIIVHEPEKLPWHSLLSILLKAKFIVLIEQRDNKLVIETKL